jgi:hypothetical protein
MFLKRLAPTSSASFIIYPKHLSILKLIIQKILPLFKIVYHDYNRYKTEK